MGERAPDAISVITWPEGWVDAPVIASEIVMTAVLKRGTATILTACTDLGTSLYVLDAHRRDVERQAAGPARHEDR